MGAEKIDERFHFRVLGFQIMDGSFRSEYRRWLVAGKFEVEWVKLKFEYYSFSVVWFVRKGATQLCQVILQRVVSCVRNYTTLENVGLKHLPLYS